ncbi:MAG: TerB family tellurite resistance protein [Gammaproteobacteria bacterium]|nr:TerB family tellurite resistance protein [Gammaproteobacteria bacterium]
MKITAYIHKVLDACDDMLAALPGGPGKMAGVQDPREVAMDLAIRSMAVMCAADGKLNGEEIDASVEAYRSRTGYSLSEDQIRMTVSSVSLESDMFWRDLKLRANMLPVPVQQEIYASGLAIAMADEELHHTESAVLDRLASVLNVEKA